MKNNRENVEKRRQRILSLVNEKSMVSVEELAELCGVSAMTVRRDLSFLSESGALVRTHGRAVANDSSAGAAMSDHLMLACRAEISRYAAGFVGDGDEIFINGSRTALDILHHISDKKVVVRTNNGYALDESYSDSIQILIIGGIPRGKIMVGEYVIQNLLQMSADSTFLGCAAVYDDGEFSYDIPTEIGINEIMISRTKGSLYILADHTKLHTRKERSNIYGSFRYDHPVTLVTDAYADEEIVGRLRDNGIRVIRVPTGLG